MQQQEQQAAFLRTATATATATTSSSTGGGGSGGHASALPRALGQQGGVNSDSTSAASKHATTGAGAGAGAGAGTASSPNSKSSSNSSSSNPVALGVHRKLTPQEEFQLLLDEVDVFGGDEEANSLFRSTASTASAAAATGGGSEKGGNKEIRTSNSSGKHEGSRQGKDEDDVLAAMRQMEREWDTQPRGLGREEGGIHNFLDHSDLYSFAVGAVDAERVSADTGASATAPAAATATAGPGPKEGEGEGCYAHKSVTGITSTVRTGPSNHSLLSRQQIDDLEQVRPVVVGPSFGSRN
jgi:hypothetical protein